MGRQANLPTMIGEDPDFYWRDWHWPAFNLADIAIFLGALLFVSSSLLGKKANTNAESDGSD
jgi:signal peptidase II